MLRRYRTVVWVLASGCMTESRFQQRYAEEYCALLSDCSGLEARGYTTVRDCESQQSLNGECTEFERDLAADCIDALEQRSCTQALESVLPRPCSRVCD